MSKATKVTIDKERMRILADVVENPRKAPKKLAGMGFNFCTLTTGPDIVGAKPECGTQCCTAGWACWLFGEKGSPINGVQAMKLLGLTVRQADCLFYNYDHYISNRFLISGVEAAAAIRRMAEITTTK
jgi:hypothetical protein